MDDTSIYANNRLVVGVALLSLALAVAAAWIARDVLLLAFFGVVLATVLSIPVGWLRRWLPRWAAIALVLLGLAGLTTLGGVVVAPPLAEQLEQFREEAPKAAREVRAWVGRMTVSAGGDPEGGAGAPALPEKVQEEARPALLAVAQGLTSAVLVGVLAVFLVSAPDAYRCGLRELLPDRWRPPFDESWRRAGDKLVAWLRGVVIAMMINGVLTAIGLWAIGMEQWFLLAVITLLFSFVPYLGAIASAIPGLLLAVPHGLPMVASTLAVYLAVQLTEGYVLTPVVMRRAVEVQPGLLLVGQGLMTAVFGLMGTIVATPLIVCIQALIGYLWVERALGRKHSDTL